MPDVPEDEVRCDEIGWDKSDDEAADRAADKLRALYLARLDREAAEKKRKHRKKEAQC